MGFNAGGTNVGGVQSIEQGNLIVNSSNIATPTVSLNGTDFIVPAGKRWIFKASSHTSSSLTATITEVQTVVEVSGIKQILKLSTGNSKVEYMSYLPLLLKAGDKIIMQTQLSAYTSGNITHNILYQELDS